jgi:hypothetical protein
MTHPERAIGALYDHEQDPREQRRRRPAPDWGGDDLFSSSPRRRFNRTTRRETNEHPLPRYRQTRDLRDHPEHRRTEPLRVPTAEERADKVARLEAMERPELDRRVEVTASGRRTVVVTGNPDRRAHRPLDAGPRRPSPTVDQRLGARPDRIAAWAFGLGLLLILIAVLSAH